MHARLLPLALLTLGCGAAPPAPPVSTSELDSAPASAAPAPASAPGSADGPADPLPEEAVPSALRASTGSTEPLPPGALRALGSPGYRLAASDRPTRLFWDGEHLRVAQLTRGGLEVRDAPSGRMLETQRMRGASPDGRTRWILPAELSRSPDGRWVSIGCGELRLLRDGEQQHRLTPPGQREPARGAMGRIAPDWRLQCVAFDAAGEEAFVVQSGGLVARVDLATGETNATLEETGCTARGIAVSADGARVACATWTGARVLDVDGSVVSTYEAPRDDDGSPRHSTAIALSEDGGTVVLASDDRLVVLDAARGEVRRIIPVEGATIEAVALSGDGAWIAAAAGGMIRVWASASGRPIPTGARHGARITDLVGSADGHTLMSADAAGQVLLWDATDGSLRARVRPADDHSVAIARSADGRRWAVAASLPSRDLELRVVDASGALAFEASVDMIARSVALSPDGARVFLGGSIVEALDAQPEARTSRYWSGDEHAERLFSLPDGRLVVGDDSADTVPQLVPATCDGRCRAQPLEVPTDPPRSSLGSLQDANRLARGMRPLGDDVVHDAGLGDAVSAGDRLFTLARSGPIHVWDAQGGYLGCWSGRYEAIDAHPSGHLIALRTGGDLQVLPASPTEPPPGLGASALHGRNHAVRCSRPPAAGRLEAHEVAGDALAVGRDLAFSAGRDGALLVWDAQALIARLDGEAAGSDPQRRADPPSRRRPTVATPAR